MSRPLTLVLAVALVAAMGLSACGHGVFLAGMVGAGRGGTPAVLLEPSGETVPLAGELAMELSRVPGALVRVTGRYRGLGERHRLVVSSYRLMDAGNGVPPHVGRLFWDGTRLLLIEDHGEGAVELRGEAVRVLRRQTGARVWVVGPVIDVETLEVLKYGMLRSPP